MVLVVMGVIHMIEKTETHTSDGLMKLGMVITVICYGQAWLYAGFSFYPSQQDPTSPAFAEGLMVSLQSHSFPLSQPNEYIAPVRRSWRSTIHRRPPIIRNHNIPRRPQRQAGFEICNLKTPQIPHERHPRTHRHLHILLCGHQDETYEQAGQGQQIHGSRGSGICVSGSQ